MLNAFLRALSIFMQKDKITLEELKEGFESVSRRDPETAAILFIEAIDDAIQARQMNCRHCDCAIRKQTRSANEPTVH